MRRSAALALGVVLAVSSMWAGSAGPAGADSTVPDGQPWGGSRVTPPPPVTAPVTEVALGGTITDGPGVVFARPTVRLTLTGDTAGCRPPPDGPAATATTGAPETYRSPTDPTEPPRLRYDFAGSLPFSADRNGDYRVFVCINGEVRMDTSIPVRFPAPTVRNVTASAAGRAITVSWDPTGAPDVSHRVERSIDSGAFSAVGLAGADAVSFVDSDLPRDGGEATYRVIGVRPNVAPAAASNTSAATFASAPADPGAPGQPGGADAGSGGEPGAGVAGSAASGGSSANTSGRPGGSTSRRPGSSIRVPRVGTPSGSFFPPLLAPPNEEDTGFSEVLPFDEDRETGPQEPVLPEDELATGPFDAAPGRGLVIPLATGLVLAVWALHLRFLARAAKPQYLAQDELPELVHW